MPSVNASGRDQALFDQLDRTNGGKANGDRKKLTKDLDTFLTLLTTQLKHQDPTSPMDTAQFTQQLVMYSQVEQQISTNEKLDSLLMVNAASLGAVAVQYIDNYIEFESDKLPLQGGKGRFAYGLGGNAESVSIAIKDENGKTVFSTKGELTKGLHEFRWDGKDSSGNQLPDGTYTLSVSAYGKTGAKDGEKGDIETYTTVFGRVTGVTVMDGEVMLVADKTAAPMSKLLSVSKTWDQAPSPLAHSAIQYLGTNVEVEGDTIPLQNGAGLFSYTLPENAEKVEITIKDSTGKTVRIMTRDESANAGTANDASLSLSEGKNALTWDGKDASGAQLPDGAYSFSITARAKNGLDVNDIPTTVTGTVTSVTSKGGEPVVSMNEVNAPITKIIAAYRPKRNFQPLPHPFQARR